MGVIGRRHLFLSLDTYHKYPGYLSSFHIIKSLNQTKWMYICCEEKCSWNIQNYQPYIWPDRILFFTLTEWLETWACQINVMCWWIACLEGCRGNCQWPSLLLGAQGRSSWMSQQPGLTHMPGEPFGTF